MKDLDTMWKQKRNEELDDRLWRLQKRNEELKHEAGQHMAEPGKIFSQCNKAYAVYLFVGIAFIAPFAFLLLLASIMDRRLEPFIWSIVIAWCYTMIGVGWKLIWGTK